MQNGGLSRMLGSNNPYSLWSGGGVTGTGPLQIPVRLFVAIASGVHALGHHLMMDLNDDEAINGSLRI